MAILCPRCDQAGFRFRVAAGLEFQDAELGEHAVLKSSRGTIGTLLFNTVEKGNWDCSGLYMQFSLSCSNSFVWFLL